MKSVKVMCVNLHVCVCVLKVGGVGQVNIWRRKQVGKGREPGKQNGLRTGVELTFHFPQQDAKTQFN